MTDTRPVTPPRRPSGFAVRGAEWVCACSGIRAASCPRCRRCGAERPDDQETVTLREVRE